MQAIAARIMDCVQSKNYGTAMIPTEAALSAELMHPNLIKTFKIVLQPRVADFDHRNYSKGAGLTGFSTTSPCRPCCACLHCVSVLPLSKWRS